jgi:hypothetical protein
MDLMARKNNLKAFEKGVCALMGAGINVTVDLIVGLPGDTEESVRRGFRYLRDGGLYSRAQVFNLAVLPGTAFRHEAGELGLHYQPRPPYYVLKTPTLDRTALYGLMHEAQSVFDVEFDAAPAPALDFGPGDAHRVWRIDLDAGRPPAPERTPGHRRSRSGSAPRTSRRTPRRSRGWCARSWRSTRSRRCKLYSNQSGRRPTPSHPDS